MLSVLHCVSAASLSRPRRSVSVLARHRPAEAHPRREDLGEAAEEHDPPLGVEALERRQRLAGEAQLAVRAVLEDEHVVPVRQLHQPPAALERQGHAGRVLEVGHGVDQLRPRVGGEDALQVVGVHPVVVGADRGVGRLARVERDQRAEERRVLGDHDVAGVEDELGDEVQALLRTLEDQHVRGRARDAVPRHALGDLLAQARPPVRHRVLEHGRVTSQEAVEHRAQLGHREQARVRVPAPERDQVGVRPKSEQVPDGRWADELHPRGEAGHHGQVSHVIGVPAATLANRDGSVTFGRSGMYVPPCDRAWAERDPGPDGIPVACGVPLVLHGRPSRIAVAGEPGMRRRAVGR